MSKKSNSLRQSLSIMDFDGCRTAMIRIVRIAIRRHIFAYARDNHIIDFADTQLVEQRHRDFLQNAKDAGVSKAADIQAATTVAELLTIYDSIADYI